MFEKNHFLVSKTESSIEERAPSRQTDKTESMGEDLVTFNSNQPIFTDSKLQREMRYKEDKD